MPKITPKNFIKFDRKDIHKTITERFEEQVSRYPENVAVKMGDEILTYHDLNRRANQLAHNINKMTGNVKGPVAFLHDHGVNQVISIIAIIKSGNGYLALDPEFPISRLEFLICDSETPILITDDKNREFATQFDLQESQILNIDTIQHDTPESNLNIDIKTDVIATLQYTSGSTGQPKGCIKTHLQMMHDQYTQTNRRLINQDDRYLLLLSASFGASSAPIFSSLLNGAGLYPYDIKAKGLGGLADFLNREKITVYYSVPSTFRSFASLLRTQEDFPNLRYIILGGETVLRKDVDLFKAHFSSACTFEVVLGGTEYQEIRSYEISKDKAITSGVIPVGYPIEDKEIILFDENEQEVPIGEIGEIVVASKYISSEYWRRSELTKTAFKHLPGRDGVIRYHTGDLGRMLPDGCLEHLGRKDRQVKIRGHRVELAEIAYSLLSIPSIVEAHVIAKPDETGDHHLIAYLVFDPKNIIPTSNIRHLLSDDLPDYMIPSTFVVLDELPKTPSRKIDVLALPDPERDRQSLESEFVSPKSEIEKQLVEIWETLMDIHPIGTKDDFFDLGGHSLLALRLIAEVEQIFGVKIPFPALVQTRTIENLAKLIQDKEAMTTWSHLVALQPLGSKPPFFCIPPSAVTVMIFKDLAKHLDKDRPFYGLEYAGMDEETEAHDNIQAMASFNLERIRVLQSDGPYYLGGMCFGGLVAYEMAKQLLTSGQEVAFLGIFDSTHAPNLTQPRSYRMFMFTRFINQKIFRQKIPLGMEPLRRSMKRFTSEDAFSNRVYQVFTTHNYARMTYRTTPYPKTITLYNTEGSRAEFTQNQWKHVADGKLEIISIPGIHSGHLRGQVEENSFIHEPQIQNLAQILSLHLDQAGSN